MSSLWESRRSKKNKKIKASGSGVWSEEDEVSVLKAMIDYEVTQQSNPYDDMGKFLDFVKPLISFDVQRKQLTDKLWKSKNKFLSSKFDSSIPHHANLLELSKSIKCWGQHANMSLDVKSDDQNVSVDTLVVDDVDLDKLVDKLSKVVENEKKGKLVSSDGQNGKLVKCCKKMGKVVSIDGQTNKMDDVVVEDVDAGKRDLVVKDKGKGDVEEDYVVDDVDIDKSAEVDKTGKKGKIVTCGVRNGKGANMSLDGDNVVSGDCENSENIANSDGQNVRGDNVVVSDVEVYKSSKLVKNKGKGKDVRNKGKGKDVRNKGKREVMTCYSQNVEQENVAIDDDVLDECLKLGKKKRKLLSRDDQNDEEVNVVFDDVDGQNDIEGNVLNKCLKVVEKKRKHLSRDGENEYCRNVVNSDGRNVRGDNVVVADVDVDKSSKVVENKGKGKVVENKGKGKDVTCDGRNVEQDNMAIEVNRKDLKEFTSMFPELTNMLELETLSRMPQHFKSKCVIDTINSMGWEKANELEEEWVDVHLMEMELKSKKLDLKSKQINLILEATRKKFRP